ncbi:MAG: hypothetical protein Q9M32_00745 [Sulfurimonas sp.]|nr:hypothetical protein [Sulfurimonas sp.]
MKKIVVASVLAAGCLFGDTVTTVVPYIASVSYDNDSAKSAKDDSRMYGMHASVGNLDYLFELDYAKFTTNYKNSAIEDLDQDDIFVAYSKYYKNWMFKVGDHYVSTNDPLLNNGNVVMASIGGYTFDGADKYSYGIEGYYSRYSDGQDENNVRKSISIIQFTPYVSFFHKFSDTVKNTLVVKFNHQSASDYVKDSYTSFEISDTIYYKDVFTTLKYYDGKMRTGVKDGGTTVINTLDLMQDGFDIKLGYYISVNAVLSVSYGQNNFQEFDVVTGTLLPSGKNSVAVAAFSYSF